MCDSVSQSVSLGVLFQYRLSYFVHPFDRLHVDSRKPTRWNYLTHIWRPTQHPKSYTYNFNADIASLFTQQDEAPQLPISFLQPGNCAWEHSRSAFSVTCAYLLPRIEFHRSAPYHCYTTLTK